MEKILIVDIETTGFLPDGKIVEIGLVELCLCCGGRKVIYNKTFNPGLTEEELNNSWIMKNGYMNVADILLSENLEDHVEWINTIIRSYPAGLTAYNRQFDVNFLEKYGVQFTKLLPCPMLLATDICKIEKKNGHAGWKWPNVEEAYKHFFPDSEYVELHRGADDAMHEAEIVYRLYINGAFKL